ncbi:MAG: SLC13 family permease, partial [Sphingomonadales bacterium]|nr:SLC13 family permease [Sphingomonadales bacterium]
PAETSPVSSRDLLSGFAEPALFAIIGLLVIGQALVATGALDNFTKALVSKGGKTPQALIIFILLFVLVTSAFMNNTPVVVIFIPILSALSIQLGRSPSLVMIPLSFAAILGGNLTLIGSSTNLLASGALTNAGQPALQFFDLLVPGSVLAVVGFAYLLIASPTMLQSRANMAKQLMIDDDLLPQGRQFIVQIEVDGDSPFLGMRSSGGLFPKLTHITLRLIQRGEKAFLPPFDDIELQEKDILVIAATRISLTALLKKYPNVFKITDEQNNDIYKEMFSVKDQMLAEAMIAPTSQMRGLSLSQIAFHHKTNCTVLGIQRRSRMIRTSLDDILLEAGDVLLIFGERKDVLKLRSSKNVMLMEWSASDAPRGERALLSVGIFGFVVLFAATGVMPVTIAALAGATAIVLSGCLTLRQAVRAIDRRIIMLVGSALAMGTALGATGGASYLSHNAITALEGTSPAIVLSVFFLIVAIITNVLSNNATAVLFIPIALSVSHELGVDPMPFIVAVIFAANCSFATPMGYQTNLMVMGPGHYQFKDYIKTGVPLIIILWITFSLFAPFYYNL